ncbi:MAG TPA: transglycosylase SLT domain-containing protein, partial [Nitrospirales bacterium]
LVRNRNGTVSQDAALSLARVYLRQGQEEPLMALASEVDAGLLSGELKAKFLMLLAAAYVDRARNEMAISTYRRVAEVTGVGSTASDALWQIGWLHYKEGRYADAVRLFDESRLQRGLSGVQALYWKARSLEKMGQPQKAMQTFQSVCSEAPNSYYCQIGRTRIGGAEITGSESAGANLLTSMEAAEPQDHALTTDTHYQRATELRLIGWQREAADELATLISRVGQDRGGALSLARLFTSTGEYHQALSLVRAHFADVIERGGAAVGQGFWQMAYPGGYFPVIRALPVNQGVDANLVTAVIREESAYNPGAVSIAGALGLMQVMPQTGQKIAAQLDPQAFDRERLFEPCYNIRFGSWYLRHLTEKFGNNLAHIIAAYNAGPDVVSKWVQQAGNKEQDEFIELIPYTETRNYVKKVLRSYGEYKRIYGPSTSPVSLTASADTVIVRCEGARVVE